ncbi:MAG: hypothetical protein WDO56_01885 [Gammaproteobacteria bacterium]
MVTGTFPFDATDITTYFIKHLKEEPVSPKTHDPSIPSDLERLVMECLAKDAKDRPVDAHRVNSDLMNIAGAIGLRIPSDAFDQEAQSRGPAKTLPPVAIDRWVKRTALFEQMLSLAFAGERPSALSELLHEVKHLVREISELRAKAITEQRSLESIESRGREVRQRFGHAVDALGIDASKARDELKAALAGAAALTLDMDRPVQDLKRALSEVLRWEGRSGFVEPYRELAAAYRQSADVVDNWYQAKLRLKDAEARVASRRGEVEDLEFQIRELRSVLAKNEEELEREEGESPENCRGAGTARGRLGSGVTRTRDALLHAAAQSPRTFPAFSRARVRRARVTRRARSFSLRAPLGYFVANVLWTARRCRRSLSAA